MQVTESLLADVLILQPRVFGDDRGFFYESWNERSFRKATGLGHVFVQDKATSHRKEELTEALRGFRGIRGRNHHRGWRR